MSDYVYINTDNYNFKMWGYNFFSDDDGIEIILYWGRIGLPMDRLSKKSKYFANKCEAIKYIKNKIKEKKYKGYFEVKNAEYFDEINKNNISTLIFALEMVKKTKEERNLHFA